MEIWRYHSCDNDTFKAKGKLSWVGQESPGELLKAECFIWLPEEEMEKSKQTSILWTVWELYGNESHPGVLQELRAACRQQLAGPRGSSPTITKKRLCHHCLVSLKENPAPRWKWQSCSHHHFSPSRLSAENQIILCLDLWFLETERS